MINVDVLLPLSMNEDIAAFSIKVPLQNIEKLLIDVANLESITDSKLSL